ncbi:hypothetical protein J6590_031279 [Homalodisca vitripennis]|nr:hypothetical protein J6590_031279 [Homalodisca vitripennis]
MQPCNDHQPDGSADHLTQRHCEGDDIVHNTNTTVKHRAVEPCNDHQPDGVPTINTRHCEGRLT